MDSGQFIETFPINTDSLPKFRSYLTSLLKKEKFQIEQSDMQGDCFVLVAARGNKFLHYLAEMLLEHLPFSELFGWAVRVQISFVIFGRYDNGDYKLRVVCEPACNDINPLSSYTDDDEPRDMTQAIGEDKKCLEAFRLFTGKLIKSSYLAQSK